MQKNVIHRNDIGHHIFTVIMQRRRRIIDDSDCDAIVPQKGSVIEIVSHGCKHRRRRIIDDSDCDAVEPQNGSAIVIENLAMLMPHQEPKDTAGQQQEQLESAASTQVPKLHPFFAVFPACLNSSIEIQHDSMDLRFSVPPSTCQYLDLESEHMAANSADSSGCSNSTATHTSDDEFVSDTDAQLTKPDRKFIAKYFKHALPITTKRLRPDFHHYQSSSSSTKERSSRTNRGGSSRMTVNPPAATSS